MGTAVLCRVEGSRVPGGTGQSEHTAGAGLKIGNALTVMAERLSTWMTR